jgi:membrane protease YdiL (CAAX protease family)
MYDILLIFIVALLGLLAHVAKNKAWLYWILMAAIFTTGLCEFSWLLTALLRDGDFLDSHSSIITILKILCAATWILLLTPARELLSWLLTGINLIITGQILVPAIRRKVNAAQYFLRNRIFIASSFPHLMALFVYVTAAAYLLISIYNSEISDTLSRPLPVPPLFNQFFSNNGIGLILLAFCGVGIYVSRTGAEAFRRLNLTKPGLLEIGVGIFLIFAGFFYDGLWAIFKHHLAGQDLATQLSGYTGSTFTVAGAFIPSVILALIITLFAGISEEILIRGALQPVFGILPSAILHGLLHAHIAHAPVFIVKVTIWSLFMGLIRRYTNTTTTIIGHAGFNLLTIFLFAANP